MHRRSSLALTLGLSAALFATDAHAETGRIGIAVQLAVNLPPDDADRIEQTLADLAAELRGYDVIAGAAAERRLPKGGVPSDCVARPDCLGDLGARLAAEHLLLLVLVRLGPEIQLDATWVEVETRRATPRPAVTLPHGDPAGQREALQKALDALMPTPRATEVASAPPTLDRDPGPGPTKTATVTLDASTPAPQARPIPWPVWAAGGIAAAALATGAGLGLSALGQRRGLDDDGCRDVQCDPDRVDRLERTATAADILVGVGVGATAVAAALYFLLPEDAPARVGASFAPDGVLVGLGGRF